MKKLKKLSGQVTIMYAVVISVLLILTGLVVDGSLYFLERRKVQNVADLSAIAGAYAKCSSENINSTILAIANDNGYDNNGSTNSVDIHIPPIDGHYMGDSDYIQVSISSIITPFLIQIVLPGDLTVNAAAVSLCDLGSAGGEGFPPEPFSAFAGGNEDCSTNENERLINITGSSNEINGPSHSNWGVRITASSNEFNGPVTLVDIIDWPTNDPFNAGYTQYSPAVNWPITPFNLDDYRPGGYYDVHDHAHYHYDNNRWLSSELVGSDDIIPEGIYVAENGIRLTGAGGSGNVTFVVLDEDGEVAVTGSNHTLTPYVDNLLAYAVGESCNRAITMSGSNVSFSGIIFSPYGSIDISGSSHSIVDGCIWGAAIDINGSDQTIGNCADYVAGGASSIKLIE